MSRMRLKTNNNRVELLFEHSAELLSFFHIRSVMLAARLGSTLLKNAIVELTGPQYFSPALWFPVFKFDVDIRLIASSTSTVVAGGIVPNVGSAFGNRFH